MRQRFHILLLTVLLLGVGCDSNDDPTLLEQFTGTWRLTAVSDDSGNQNDRFFEAANSLTLTLNADETYTLVYDAFDDAADQNLSGSFRIDEPRSELNLAAEIVAGVPADVPFVYTFVEDNQVELTISAFVVNGLLEIDPGSETALLGAVKMTITKQ
ncbi:MAG: hypothetical protein RhofKO_42150 [Rhodothermales bacterium]